ncbi:MAG TPA: hypothetical protein VFT22_42815 [Kofleriaceae bacterium]|nr:hypothetical protein [Kofleriaceae bacterium]
MSAPPAWADAPRDTPAAIEVDRDATPAGRVGFRFDGGEPVDAWGASVTASWLERPIRVGAGAFGGGAPASEPVRRRQTLAIGGAIAVGDSVVLDLALRGSHQVGDRLHAAGDPSGLARFVFQDLRLGGRIRVVGDDERAALLRADLTLASGDAEQFAGDASWTAAWSLIGRATLPRAIVIAVNAGIRLHGAEVMVGDRLVGDEVFAAAGASVPLPVRGPLAAAVRVTGELSGALGDRIGGRSGPSPLEARLGAVVQPLPELAVGARLGAGLDDQIGAPRLRAVIELAWTPRVARPARPPEPAEESDEESDQDADEPQAPASPAPRPLQPPSPASPPGAAAPGPSTPAPASAPPPAPAPQPPALEPTPGRW